jgi:spermidine/putrescine transport system ATP-binding protein
MTAHPAQAALSVRGVTHSYGGDFALADVDLEVPKGEFLTFLGPSGCGKTTLLRIVAGFIRPTRGNVLLDGVDVTRVPAHKRPVHMVFQRPTLFPHLDVFENVAFGLRVAGLTKPDITRRVGEALELVRLDGFERRRSAELSGGQMQRIALARAVVNRPPVLLLDEPLSALDLKIRLEMEVELRRVHREIAATFVYVTHDQREALALSDRIAVFDNGRIDQLATPADIYTRPATPFAARFVGDANVLPCEVVAEPGACAALLGGVSVPLDADTIQTRGPAWLVVRPEAVRFADATAVNGTGMRGRVRDVAYRGTAFTYRVEIPGMLELVKAEIPADAGPPVEVGGEVGLRWDRSAAAVLARADDVSQHGAHESVAGART